MALISFKLLMLAVFVSNTYNGNSASETSEFECRIPDNSSIDHSMNVHLDLSEGEFELLQIEGRCFLFCTTEEEYSNEVNSKCKIILLLFCV